MRVARAGPCAGPEGTVRSGLAEFRILGPLEVVDERGVVRLGGTRQRAALAVLLLNANRVVSVDRIVEDLYAGTAPVTALKQVQRQISELRKTIGSMSVIETHSPGYVIRLSPEQLDLSVFERLAADAGAALSAGDPGSAADLWRQALGLWRGAPLADLTYESFAQAAIERLDEIRLAALEQRIDADLALGRAGELVAELGELVQEHPVRERFHAQLMLALYQCGRQAEALSAYREARTKLMDAFGIEPGPALKQLEHQILEQDPRLERVSGASAGRQTGVLAVTRAGSGVAALTALAKPLARAPGQELILAQLVETEGEIGAALRTLEETRQGDAIVRVAAFTSAAPADDVVRLTTAYDVQLVLIEELLQSSNPSLPSHLVMVLNHSPADVGLVTGPPVDWESGNGIFVPFGGTEHDWAALELGAWFASAAGAPLRLVGARADPSRGRRDASRLLANASLAVQRLVDIRAEPLLVDASPDALAGAVESGTLVVVGLSPRWRTEGVGPVRGELLRTRRPVVLVHSGPRPSGLAPRDARTRFTWSLGA